MRHSITARHCVIPKTLRVRALAVLERLGNHASRPVDGSVVFDTGPNRQTVEIRLHLATGTLFVATGDGSNHRSALDRAEEKLRRQLDKGVPRTRRTRGTASGRA
ncbi:MAG: HPF/RaiA family ribosome-associated protein [Gemmatimonadales bacterium]